MKAKYLLRSTGAGGKEYLYHRRAGYKLIPLSDEVDPSDQSAVDADFLSKRSEYVSPDARALRSERKQLVLKSVGRARRRAHLLGRKFDITAECVERMMAGQDGRCALSNIRFDFGASQHGRSNPFRPSIDRIDPNGGYTRDNIRIVLVAVNIGLADFGEAAYVEVCRAVARQNKNRT